MSSDKDCEYSIDCNKCRRMCTSYANHMYSIGLMQGRAAERERIVRELEELKATAIDLVKLPNFIKKDLKELTDMCFDEAIEIVKGVEND